MAAAHWRPRFNAQWKHDIWIEKRVNERGEKVEKNKGGLRGGDDRETGGAHSGIVSYQSIQICRLGKSEGRVVSYTVEGGRS